MCIGCLLPPPFGGNFNVTLLRVVHCCGATFIVWGAVHHLNARVRFAYFSISGLRRCIC